MRRVAPFDAPVPTRASLREWQHLTGSDFAQMDRGRTVVLVTCSPLEVHGPHLPVITDNLEAEGLTARMTELLAERDPEMRFVRLPPIYVASDLLPHPGSVAFRASTIVRVLCDLGRSLAKQGFVHVWVGNFHGGPRHFVPIEVAAERTNRRWGTKMVSTFSLLIKRLTGGGSDLAAVLGHIRGVTPADLVGDTHGGAIETSMMLHLAGPHVDPRYVALPRTTVDTKLERAGLPPTSHDGVRELLRGFKHKLRYYESETYSGKPSIATPEIGREMVDVLARHGADALYDVYTGKLPPEECHSPLWPLRWLFTNRPLGWAFERAVGYRNRVF
jgi:creatinine amidohydrolase